MGRQVLKLTTSDDGDDEINSLMHETNGDVTPRRKTDPLAQEQQQSTMSTVPSMKALVALLFGLCLLFATDTIEIKSLKNIGKSKTRGAPVSNGSTVTKSHPGAEVETQTYVQTGSKVDAEPDKKAETKVETTKPDDHAKDNANSNTDAAAGTTTEIFRYTYKRRGQPIDDASRKSMVDKWGRWSWDDEPQRPNRDDLYDKYPNRDVPADAWPAGSWQRDKAYLERYLTEGLALVTRAQEAILAEYGYGIDTYSGEDKSFQARSKQFEVKHGDDAYGNADVGGYFSKSSWAGLKRRLLHAMMTEDSFNFAMGGHSAAAGHGNHFIQSYTLQVGWIMEPIFARLGVKHESRNFGNGGMGTLHNGMAAGMIYGPDVSLLMWDSGMTEKEAHAPDVMARQSMIGGIKVPVLLAFPQGVAKSLNSITGADVGNLGNWMGITSKKSSLEDVENDVWATKFVNCEGQLQKDVCRPNEYNGTCWIPRPDYTPETKQSEAPGGRASWHPGNRHHQMIGRSIACMLLTAMKEVLTEWKSMDDFIVPDDQWHLTDKYESIRSKLQAGGLGTCGGLSKFGMEFLCKTPMKARTQFSPRAYPQYTSIRTIMPDAQEKLLGPSKFNQSVYSAPDVFNPLLHPPPGEVDVLSIVESGSDFRPIVDPQYTAVYDSVSTPMEVKVTPGKGIVDIDPPGICDGTLYSFCKRSKSNACLLSGQNDARTGLRHDGYSGWIVMHLPRVKFGRVIVKFHSWMSPKSTSKTEGWSSINNEDEDKTRRFLKLPNTGSPDNTNNHLKISQRRLDTPTCPEFHFEYAIDGKVTSLNLEQYKARNKRIQRVVETIVIMDDPSYTGGVEKDVEVAVRITGCGREKTFELTHIYWG